MQFSFRLLLPLNGKSSNHQPHGCLLNRLFRRRSKKKSKLPVTGLCVGNSPGPVNSPHQRASYAENVSIWWRHHVFHTHQIRGGGGLRLSDCFLCYCIGLDDIFQKNIGRHAAHNIVWWPNHKHWLIIYTSDLMMIRYSRPHILAVIACKMGLLKTHSLVYRKEDVCENWRNHRHARHNIFGSKYMYLYINGKNCIWPIF